jgi:putative redox protein
LSEFKITFPGNKKVDVEFDNFTVKTDQKKIYGGDETAPDPFNIFLSSLSACAGIFAISFCNSRNLDSEGMFLNLEPVFKDGQKFMDEIKLTLHVNKSFPEKYFKPIIKAMNGCSVKNQLHPDIKTSTSVVYPD